MNKKMVYQKAKEHYENNKERLQQQARNRYRRLSEKEKDKKKRILKKSIRKICQQKINKN